MRRTSSFAGTHASNARGAPLVPGADAAVSVRQHEIELAAATAAAAGGNALQGTVVRNVFLGSARDYIVEVTRRHAAARHGAARAATSRRAQRCGCTLPPERCRALVG